ncbi:MAG: Prolyl-tRNA synthetase [Candidatus Yanofskybacteria bacterium GW2011_GWA2_41_22]|uniref:Proline--tRNA ligase n=4 Tax=Parcubacteria group TaxID=1794811 RepID=A0A0G0VKZ2_9BACT|nr:MAG: Prolyl-tRNA synthetase [Candidatus Yanofskybacteria bacterium GW2011_GWA2_41_22]KKS27294.1 MAG: Prolyl-tRNA synthetase [Candidatus Yanofskybacteria bacterium GW2011_GWC2_41_9]OGM99920.1 MAG: hypothetical protein A2736_03060 [Candidatus Yanofskybacteria bacterium RIFCSPHIGHO2_01_FULL_41_27]OGN10163.1 MAG: hypothetical protein A3C64_02520 [Candidatus Yanofskybacteria bacterium RIFCSPHIGHO2_02_FULL_41_12]OGN20803.1 MAG: hypothetical protein A3B00_00510 [Candidatus Yanofskybacteria bacteriu
MKLSQLFTKTIKEVPADEVAKNAQLLIRGGFIYKNSAGIYSFLPLGWRVMQKIFKIIREEMDEIGGQEMFMPAMVEKKYLEATNRWNLDVGFDVITKKNPEADSTGSRQAGFALGWTHEEVLSAIVSKYVSSYKDLPFSAYQIQTKFRNEARAKSGLLRGKEFMMKDLYSFHADENDLFKFYEKVKGSYMKIFDRCHLRAIYTMAGGGAFTISNTHEFQIISDVGEDTILICSQCEYAENIEVTQLKEGAKCPKCDGGGMFETKAIEAGNIFPLGTKYSEALDLKFVDENGDKKFVVMGSYGIGVSRLMAVIAEIHNDEKGIIWPENIAPFKYHLIVLDGKNQEAGKVYDDLIKSGEEVLYDDREDKTAGEKFADADLIGCPVRIVISEKTLAKNSAEIKKRDKKEIELVSVDKIT